MGVRVLSYHLPFKSSYEGWRKMKIFLVFITKESIWESKTLLVFFTNTHSAKPTTMIWDGDICLWLCYLWNPHSMGTLNTISEWNTLILFEHSPPMIFSHIPLCFIITTLEITISKKFTKFTKTIVSFGTLLWMKFWVVLLSNKILNFVFFI